MKKHLSVFLACLATSGCQYPNFARLEEQGMQQYGFVKEKKPPSKGWTIFDPHDRKYWWTQEDDFWQEHGYPDPIKIP